MILAITVIVVLVSIILLVIRGVIGSTVFDRLLVAYSCGTNAIILIAVQGAYLLDDSMLDLAILCALVNFIVILTFLKFLNQSKQQGS